MRITAELSHPAAAPATVVGMLLDPDFQRRTCLAAGADPASITVDRSGRRTTTVRRMPTEAAAALVRRRAPDGVVVREQLDWSGPDSAGAWRGRLQARMLGQPVRMAGTLTVRPLGTGAGSVATLDAELLVTVPFLPALLAGRVEALVAPLVRAAVDAELAVGRDWLDRLPAFGVGSRPATPARRP